ncbi:MAG: hypothetical protein ABR587_03955 [Candidatus Binatia bacterium]
MTVDSRRSAALLWWVLAFVLHRFLIVLFAFDGVFFWEEAYRLLVAESLRGGWDIPLHDLQADPYAGGSLVFSALAAVATSTAGSSLVVLKTVALAWSALGLALWLLVTDRVFGRRAAHLLGFAWLAAPPVFVVFNVTALGSHSDTITLTGLQLLLMYRYLDDRSTGRLVAWMGAAGLALWFSYASALPIAVFTAYVLAAGALPLARWPAAAAGFLAGFSPWIAYNLAAGGSLDVVAQTFAGGGDPARGYLANLFDLTVRGTPVALYFRDIGIAGDVKVSREFLAYPYLAVYVASWAALMAAPVFRLARSTTVWRPEVFRAAVAGCPELPILALFPFFLAVIAASNQEFNDYGVVRYITFRILVPALPSLFFAVALAAARAGTPLRVSVVAAYTLAALVGTGQLLADGRGGRATREAEARALGAEAMGHLIVFKHGTDADVARERIAALPEELRAPAWRGVGSSYAYLFGTKRSGLAASELTRALERDGGDRAAMLEGARLAIGPGLFQVAPLPESPRRDELRRAIEDADGAARSR